MGPLLGRLLNRLHWNLTMTDDTEPDDTDDGDETGEQATDNGGVHFDPVATLTKSDGTTTTTEQFSVTDLNVQIDRDADSMDEVSAGLSKVTEDATYEFQLTLEVPTKTVTCPKCDYPNQIPVWAFVNVEFSGDMAPLSGEYAIGHQCVQCGFPY